MIFHIGDGILLIFFSHDNPYFISRSKSNILVRNFDLCTRYVSPIIYYPHTLVSKINFRNRDTKNIPDNFNACCKMFGIFYQFEFRATLNLKNIFFYQ